MTARFWIRKHWLAVRRRTLPWCMHAGCWRPSTVRTLRDGSKRRGNICDAHLWRALETLFAECNEP